MSSLRQHELDCERFLQGPFTEVHLWLDEFSSVLGPTHRRVRHHSAGIALVGKLFGQQGAKAAAIHILRDCRNIPSETDYESGEADKLGLKYRWPVSAYILYSETDFERLVMNTLYGASCTLLWGFLDEAVFGLLSGFSRLDTKELEEKVPLWQNAVAAKDRLDPYPKHLEEDIQLPDAALAHFDQFRGDALTRFEEQTPNSRIAMVDIDALITPLIFIDHEYIEDLKAELQGGDDISIAKFALPLSLKTRIRGVSDASLKHMTFVSSQKNLTVGPVQVHQTPFGAEVRFLVSSSPSLVLVERSNSRLLLRNGIHRAYLLKSLGHRYIPCLMIDRDSSDLNVDAQAYPVFSPGVLSAPRPPMLRDYFLQEIATDVPLQRTNKIVKVSAEESLLPVE